MIDDAWMRLRQELRSWKDEQLVPTFWWRDDDAIEPTRALDSLLASVGDVPLALAVIPGNVRESLSDYIGEHPSVWILQHGWRHVSYATDRGSEYPADRDPDDVLRELLDGRSILTALFGARALPMFVAPYHDFADHLLPLLPRCGLSWISGKGPRASRSVLPGLSRVNVHVAPIEWTTPPTFGSAESHLDGITEHLSRRRSHDCDFLEPTGLVTHHLDQTAESLAFMTELVSVSRQEGGAIWLDACGLVTSDTAEAQREDA